MKAKIMVSKICAVITYDKRRCSEAACWSPAVSQAWILLTAHRLSARGKEREVGKHLGHSASDLPDGAHAHYTSIVAKTNEGIQQRLPTYARRPSQPARHTLRKTYFLQTTANRHISYTRGYPRHRGCSIRALLAEEHSRCAANEPNEGK